MLDTSAWSPQGSALVKRVATWISGSLSQQPVEPLNTLAGDIYAYQCARDPIASALSLGPIDDISAIPALSVQLFKDLSVGTVAEGEACVAFMTSGTTQVRRGVHRMRHTALYDWSATHWARRCIDRLPTQGAHFLLDPGRHPESSLSHMANALTDHGSTWHLTEGVVQTNGFRAALQSIEGPVFMGTTAFALAEFCQSSETISLHPESVLMVTGGFKGRQSHLSSAELMAKTRVLFPGIRCVTEYGMTELSSQMWGLPDSPFLAPPWMYVWAIDPIDGTPLPPGQVGQLRFFDLANVDSALVIETLDRGSVEAGRRVTLLGRLPQAEARGCSLTIEEAYTPLTTT